MTELRTLADAKRAIKPGVRLRIRNTLRPEANRDTVVIKAQTKAFSTEAAGAGPRGSWANWPKAAEFRIIGPASFAFLDPNGEPWLSYEILPDDGPTTVRAGPFEAGLCPECKQWIYFAGGPFAEGGDRTKPIADFLHFERHHKPDVQTGAMGTSVIGIPFFRRNDAPVLALVEPPEAKR